MLFVQIEDKIGDVSTCAAVYRALRDEEPVALKAMFNFAWENEDDMMRYLLTREYLYSVSNFTVVNYDLIKAGD